MTSHARLRVDAISCDGRKLCAELLPEVVSLDDWGFPIIRGGDLPSSLRPRADEAIRLCPRLALWMERSD